MLLSYRPLLWFWGGVVWVTVVGGSTLQILGPPSHPVQNVPVQAVAASPIAAPPLVPPSPPSVQHVEQSAPVLPPPSVAEAVAIPAMPPLADPAPPLMVEPGRPRPHTLVRRSAAPVTALRVRSESKDVGPAERSPLLRAATPMISAPSEQATGYIGVFATGPDGTRTFKAMP